MNAIDVLTYGHEMIRTTIARFEHDRDWERLALGVWTAKDLVGHLGAFELRFADILATFADRPVVSALMDADPATFNDDQAAVRKDWPIAAILDELAMANDRVMQHARLIPDARWREVGTIPWYGPEYALDDLVVYSMYGHKREHDPQLASALETEPAAG